tara:strand:+ start:3874 stop:4431 length:558 start_codon:yes stop_codon:yes gene_type:complete
MACDSILSGRLDMSCKTIVGGLKNLYILESFDSSLKADSTITAGVMTATTAVNNVYKFELVSDANTFSEENEVSRENGTSLFNQTGAVVFKKQDSATQDLLERLSKMRAQVVLEDHMGNFRLAGLENGVDFTVATVSGGAMADMNGYNLAFTGKETSLAVYVTPALVAAGAATGFDVNSTVIDPS